MSHTVKQLEYIADNIRNKEHSHISNTITKTEEDKVAFMNAVRTLQVHADYLQQTTLWNAS